ERKGHCKEGARKGIRDWKPGGRRLCKEARCATARQGPKGGATGREQEVQVARRDLDRQGFQARQGSSGCNPRPRQRSVQVRSRKTTGVEGSIGRIWRGRTRCSRLQEYCLQSSAA